MSRIDKILIAVPSLIVLTVFVLWQIGDEGSPGFLRNLFLDERAFEVSIDLTVDGERLTVRRKINCSPHLEGKELTTYRTWQPAFPRFGERLMSGGAVMVMTPEMLCGMADLKDGEQSRDIPIPDGHIPLIGWADDADHPRFIELYVSRDYYTRRNARVRFHGMTARAIRYDFAYPDEDEFEWFYWGNRQRPLRLQYHGFYVQPVTEKQWASDKAIANFVRSLDRLTVLPKDLTLKLGKYTRSIDQSWFAHGRGTLPGPTPSGQYSRRFENREVGPLSPLLREGDHYVVRLDEQGYFLFVRSKHSAVRRGAWPTITVVIEDRTLRLDTFGWPALYDPGTRTIYRVETVWINFPNSTAQ